jgi:hypothetical protein
MARHFRKEILGVAAYQETGLLQVCFGYLEFSFNRRSHVNRCRIFVHYYDGDSRLREFTRHYDLNEIPASLPRHLVRLGASDAYMRELQAAYEKSFTPFARWTTTGSARIPAWNTDYRDPGAKKKFTIFRCLT